MTKNTAFQDQRLFMEACGQTTRIMNKEQYDLYKDLMEEEFSELYWAEQNEDIVEIADALADFIVVTMGAGFSLGLPMDEIWDEVIRSNMAKIDPITGKVKKREDGKILKPDGWTPPQIARILKAEG